MKGPPYVKPTGALAHAALDVLQEAVQKVLIEVPPPLLMLCLPDLEVQRGGSHGLSRSCVYCVFTRERQAYYIK